MERKTETISLAQTALTTTACMQPQVTFAGFSELQLKLENLLSTATHCLAPRNLTQLPLVSLAPSEPLVHALRDTPNPKPNLKSKHSGSNSVNSVQTRCIVKGEAQKSPLFWRFSGGF